MWDYGEVCFAGFMSIEDHDYANSDQGKAEIMLASFVGLLWVACTGALGVGGSSCWENNQVIVIDFTTVNLNDNEMSCCFKQGKALAGRSALEQF